MWKNLALLFIGITLFMLLLVVLGIMPELYHLIYSNPGGDKIAHIIFMGVLSYLVNLIIFPRTVDVYQKTFLLGTFLMVVFVTVEEFSQIFIPGRYFDLLDLALSYIGIGLSAWLFDRFKVRRTPTTDFARK